MINYHIYTNDGLGGPVDYTTVIATTAGLTWTSPALPAGARRSYAVRSFDTVTGLEERNVDAVATIVLDAARADVTNLPDPPEHLTVQAGSAGTAIVHWSFPFHADVVGRPTGFHVYAGSPTPAFSTVAATVPYGLGVTLYRATLSGLAGGTTYQVCVRSYNATGEEQNTVVASVVASTTAPANVDSLTATATATA